MSPGMTGFPPAHRQRFGENGPRHEVEAFYSGLDFA